MDLGFVIKSLRLRVYRGLCGRGRSLERDLLGVQGYLTLFFCLSPYLSLSLSLSVSLALSLSLSHTHTQHLYLSLSLSIFSLSRILSSAVRILGLGCRI